MKQSQGTSIQINMLGTAPVGRLYLRMSLPIILGMLVNGTYTLVDAAFVTRAVGPLAMGGIALMFPLHMLMYSSGAMIGNGAASIIARMIGANQWHAAHTTAISAILMGLIVATLFMALGLIFIDPILAALGVTAALIDYSKEFAIPLLLGAPLIVLSTVFAELLRAEGKAGAMSAMLLLSTLSNIALDALFIFVLKSGVAGVAYGTLIALGLGLAVAISLYLRQKTAIKLKLTGFSADSKIMLNILALGLPAFIGNGGIAVMVGMTNKALSQYGGLNADLLISAYGVVGRIAAFIQLPLIGMMIGYQTIAGYNYGARQFARVLQALRLSLATATVYTLLCSGFMIFCPEALLQLFTSEPELIEQGAAISRVIFLGLGFAGVSIMGGGLFQALGKAKSAMFLSTVKVFFVLTPLLLILPGIYGIGAVWYAFPIADFVVFAIVLGFLARQYMTLRNAPGNVAGETLSA